MFVMWKNVVTEWLEKYKKSSKCWKIKKVIEHKKIIGSMVNLAKHKDSMNKDTKKK